MSNGTAEGETLLTLSLIVNVVVDGTLCVLGYVGNILAIVVLSKDKVRNSNIFLLQVLAVYDIIFLTHTVLYTVLRSIYPSTGHLKAYYDISPYIIAFDLPFGWIAQTGTIWFTTVLAADRYLGITRPFKALTICTLQNAKKATAGLSVLAFLFNFPRFFYYFQVAVYSDNNSTFVAHVRVELPGFDANIYRYVYHITLTFIFLYIIPLSALTVLNYKLIKTLQIASKARKRMSMCREGTLAKSQNVIVTFNLVIVISKFILCETPDFISSIVGAIPAAANSTEYKMFNTIKEMLLVFNSAANFYIYCIFNVKFRENLLKLFPCCPRRNLREDTRINASTNAINSSISSISLAVTAFKGYKGNKGSVNNLHTIDYRRKQERSESSTDVLEEKEPPPIISNTGRSRFLSDESQLTVSTNVDSEPDIISDIPEFHQSDNDDYVVFKSNRPSHFTWPSALRQCAIINSFESKQLYRTHYNRSPQGASETGSEGIPQSDTSPKTQPRVSDNDDYVIFKPWKPLDQRVCLGRVINQALSQESVLNDAKLYVSGRGRKGERGTNGGKLGTKATRCQSSGDLGNVNELSATDINASNIHETRQLNQVKVKFSEESECIPSGSTELHGSGVPS